MEEPANELTSLSWRNLASTDAAALQSAVAAHPEWPQEIYALFRRGDGALVLHLGAQTGPYAGGGEVVVAQRQGEGWELVRTGFWTL
ncbi:MAG: hypothetical protein JSR82_07970 [Verrucomicrobia bacterium]|nr:hypothetical protein [Verrucomicrobiota bacterium]